MHRGIVLHQRPDSGGQDLPVMRFVFLARLVAAQTLGPVDERGHGHRYALLLEAITDRRVIVAGDGQAGIIHQGALPQQLVFHRRFDGRR